MIFFAPAPPRRVTTKNQKIVGVLNTLFSRRILWPEQSVARHPPAVLVDTKCIGSTLGGWRVSAQAVDRAVTKNGQKW